jgi:hypothetical protein
LHVQNVTSAKYFLEIRRVGCCLWWLPHAFSPLEVSSDIGYKHFLF